MRVDQAQFMEKGYIILRNVIPPDQLDSVRESYEVLVERQKAVWARERQPDDPPGGVWESHQQPRLSHVEELVDKSTANAVELWLHENTLGVAQQLIRAPELAVTEMMLMCNPVHDHPGGTGWHRDFQPATQAPVEGLTEDLRANGPGYVQWNIPLYDDNVLWVVPGSHLRVNTEAEERQMAEDPQAPLPGCIPVPLNAGDGVVYTNLIWHWGSNYSTRLRRTIHGGHASIAPPLYAHIFSPVWDQQLRFVECLPAAARQTLERMAQLLSDQRDLLESLFRAMLDKDGDRFLRELAALRPGEEGRMVCLVMLSKVVQRMRLVSRPEVRRLPRAERAKIVVHRDMLDFDENLAGRFTQADVERIWQRFAVLDAKLQADSEQHVSWSRSGKPSRYIVNEMPANFGVAEFVASWNGQNGAV